MNASELDRQPLSLSDKEFKMFRELIFDRSGINLHEGKKELLRTRLGKKMRQIGTRSFKEYFERIKADKTGRELMDLLDAISTNLTSFFREINHFKFLEDTVIPEIKAHKTGGNEREMASRRLIKTPDSGGAIRIACWKTIAVPMRESPVAEF